MKTQGTRPSWLDDAIGPVTITITERVPHVRCLSCGAPRVEGEGCPYCRCRYP